MHVAAQQLSKCEHCQMGLWMVLRETTVCFIATSLSPPFFIFPPLQIQRGMKQMPWLSKNVLVLFSVGASSLQSLQSLDTCSIHKVQTLALWNMPCLDFCPFLYMFLMYTQLLMSWREEMLCPISGWLYMRLNFKTLNTWGTLVSIHMWMCVCAGPSRDFIEVFEGYWVWLTLHQSRTRMLALQSSWKPGEMKPQAMVPLSGRNWGDSHISEVTLLTWKVYGRGAFAMYMLQWLNSMWDSQDRWPVNKTSLRCLGGKRF